MSSILAPRTANVNCSYDAAASAGQGSHITTTIEAIYDAWLENVRNSDHLVVFSWISIYFSEQRRRFDCAEGKSFAGLQQSNPQQAARIYRGRHSIEKERPLK
jgi:hypothetical protein